MALLEDAALDSGLTPKDVRRQIECGLSAAGSAPPLQDGPESTGTGPDGSTVQEPPEAAISDSRGPGGQTCQQMTGAPLPAAGDMQREKSGKEKSSYPMTGVLPPTAGDLQAALAKLWGSTPAPKDDQGEAAPQSPALDGRSSPAVLPPDPPPLIPLPSGAVGSGKLDKPCRCGSTEFVDVAIGEGRTRRDCRRCGRFVGFGRWYDQGGPTP